MILRSYVILFATFFAAGCLFKGQPTPCESYCERMEETCEDVYERPESEGGFDGSFETCEDTCKTYRDDPDISNDDVDGARNDNTLECRLRHSLLAERDGSPNNGHCEHSGRDGAGGNGSGGRSTTGTCTSPCFLYCEIYVDPAEGEGCTSIEAFELDFDQCLDACRAIDVGAANTKFEAASQAAEDGDPAGCEAALPDAE